MLSMSENSRGGTERLKQSLKNEFSNSAFSTAVLAIIPSEDNGGMEVGLFVKKLLLSRILF